jgi:hypothetical protein
MEYSKFVAELQGFGYGHRFGQMISKEGQE